MLNKKSILTLLTATAVIGAGAIWSFAAETPEAAQSLKTSETTLTSANVNQAEETEHAASFSITLADGDGVPLDGEVSYAICIMSEDGKVRVLSQDEDGKFYYTAEDGSKVYVENPATNEAAVTITAANRVDAEFNGEISETNGEDVSYATFIIESDENGNPVAICEN